MGNPDVVSVSVQTHRFSEEPLAEGNGVFQDVEDHAVVVLHFEDGKSAVVETAWVSNMTPCAELHRPRHQGRPAVRSAQQDGGRSLGDDEYDPLREARKARGGGPAPSNRASEEQVFAHPEVATADYNPGDAPVPRQRFGGVQPETSGDEALKIMRIIDAPYRSADLGTSVRLAEVGSLGPADEKGLEHA